MNRINVYKIRNYIARVWYTKEITGELICLNEELVAMGLAVHKEY